MSHRARLTAGSQVSPADLHSSPATIARKTASFRGLAAARLAPLTATTAVNGPGFAMRRVDDSKSGPDLDSTIRWRNLERSTWRSEESNGSHAHQSAREKGEGNVDDVWRVLLGEGLLSTLLSFSDLTRLGILNRSSKRLHDAAWRTIWRQIAIRKMLAG